MNMTANMTAMSRRRTDRMRPRLLLALLMALAGAGWGCAHAPPVTGNRAPGAGPDPDYPEINCGVNNTVDCRPTAD